MGIYYQTTKQQFALFYSLSIIRYIVILAVTYLCEFGLLFVFTLDTNVIYIRFAERKHKGY